RRNEDLQKRVRLEPLVERRVAVSRLVVLEHGLGIVRPDRCLDLLLSHADKYSGDVGAAVRSATATARRRCARAGRGLRSPRFGRRRWRSFGCGGGGLCRCLRALGGAAAAGGQGEGDRERCEPEEWMP